MVSPQELPGPWHFQGHWKTLPRAEQTRCLCQAVRGGTAGRCDPGTADTRSCQRASPGLSKPHPRSHQRAAARLGQCCRPRLLQGGCCAPCQRKVPGTSPAVKPARLCQRHSLGEGKRFCSVPLIITWAFKTPFSAGLAAERRHSATTSGHCLCPGSLPHSARGGSSGCSLCDGPSSCKGVAGEKPPQGLPPALGSCPLAWLCCSPSPRPGDGWTPADPCHRPWSLAQPSSPHWGLQDGAGRGGRALYLPVAPQPSKLDLCCYQMERNSGRNLLLEIHILVKQYGCFIPWQQI